MTAMNQLFTRISSCISAYAGKAVTFLLAIMVIVVWGLSGPLFGFSDTWQLVDDGVRVIEPAEGEMACGEFGPGRLPEPAEIVQQLADLLK